MRESSQEQIMLLQNLGVSVRGSYQVENVLDPEVLFLRFLKLYWSDNSSFFLILKSLRHRIGHLININRLIKLAEVTQISNDEKCLLIAVCEILSKDVEPNFVQVYKKLYNKNLNMSDPPKTEVDKFLISEYGVEESLLKFNVKVRKFYNESEKKLLTYDAIFKINPWLKYRAVIGPNTRADVLYLFFKKVGMNYSQIAKKALCSRQAVHKICSKLEVSSFEKLLNLSSINT